MSVQKQKNLRLIVTSATMDAEHLCNFFNNSTNTKSDNKATAVIMSIEGRLYPVNVHYLRGKENNKFNIYKYKRQMPKVWAFKQYHLISNLPVK